MNEAQVFGALLPAHQDIMPILKDIREKYGIPEISSTDDGMKILLRHELEFDWKAIHAEILERIKEAPDLLPEPARKVYAGVRNLQNKPLEDPEFEKVSPEFRDNIRLLVDLITKQYSPIARDIDAFYHTIADHCIEYLITGETRAIPESWLCNVSVSEVLGEKVIVVQANGAADPDEIMEKFKKKFAQTYGKRKKKLTEKHVRTADYLRMKWEKKSYLYILEEMELREPEDAEKSKRYPTSLRKKNDRLRQRLSRMQKDLNSILS